MTLASLQVLQPVCMPGADPSPNADLKAITSEIARPGARLAKGPGTVPAEVWPRAAAGEGRVAEDVQHSPVTQRGKARANVGRSGWGSGFFPARGPRD